MIGVISKDSQKLAVEEFFELFKVPWEFYDQGKTYDVVIITDNKIAVPPAKLIVIFGSEINFFDIEHKLQFHTRAGGLLLEHSAFCFPIYQNVAIFRSSNIHFLNFIKVKDKEELVGIEYILSDCKILRIGYDLFDEIAFILSRGQTVEYAQIPTVEIHISMLRNWILGSGLPVIEIPPHPYGYTFICCLTHDVDFIGIRPHRLDRSVLGFIYRALFPFGWKSFWSKKWWLKYFRNIKALISMPGVYTGIVRDFWFDIDKYMELEKEISSTFFFVPFKDHPGDKNKNGYSRYRSVRYDIDDYKDVLYFLIRKGNEIGVHGLDSWHDTEKAEKERKKIHSITGEEPLGVRIHWLYFTEASPQAIEGGGFLYDSSLGFNETVGYRSGTTHVFRLKGSSQLFELPLHIMDTTLFSPRRMNLSEIEALKLCGKLVKDVRTHGGVLTINWHTRSLSPERNWDTFYIDLLKILKAENVWFATAKQAVNWFNKRRSIHFDDIKVLPHKIRVKLNSDNDNSSDVMLRVHFPHKKSIKSGDSSSCKYSFIDIPWSGNPEIEVTS